MTCSTAHLDHPNGTAPPRPGGQTAFIVKWVASVAQILGYTATAAGWTPWNIWLFLFGLLGWFAVGLLWKDRAIILIHLVALAAMIAGLASI
jgi:hypothetical protein